MSALPTLLIKGKLVAPDGDPATQRDLNEVIPLDYIIDWFRKRDQKTGVENRVLVLKSETASGKSTALPPAIYNNLVRGKPQNAPGIICTQPRTMTAIENVIEMLKYNADTMRLREQIGWSTKNNKIKPTITASLLSATVGTLTQQLATMTDEEIMDRYRFIMIDETHERDLQTDMTIYILKNFLDRVADSPKCPFIVFMSATFEPDSFLEFFNVGRMTNFIWCRGEAAGFDEIWDWNQGRTVNDYPRAAATVVEKIVRENPDDPPARADVLIFMPGSEEIGETAKWLRSVNERIVADGIAPFSILKIDSEAARARSDSRDYMYTIYVPVAKQRVTVAGKQMTPGRRVIISTNVAETGLTLENLKYVVDGGYNREVEFNPVHGVSSLLTKPAPKSRVNQRRGRAGRKFRGVFYPLYPYWIYERLQDIQFPQILLNDASPIMLQMVAEQLKTKFLAGISGDATKQIDPIFDIKDTRMLDLPSADSLARSIERLYVLGFIADDAPRWSPDWRAVLEDVNPGPGMSLTHLGIVAAKLSMLQPEAIRMILGAYFWRVSPLDIVTVAAWSEFDQKTMTVRADMPEDGSPPPQIFIDWEAVYKAGLPGFFHSGSVFRFRAMVGDSLIDGIVLAAAIERICRGSGTHPHKALVDWCKSTNINFRNCVEFIKKREDLLNQLVDSGLDLFGDWPTFRGITEQTLTNYITRIKYCIYDGYRMNILHLRGGAYYTVNGLKVTVPKLFRDDERKKVPVLEKLKPQKLIYTGLTMKYKRKTGLYEVEAVGYSALDGFIAHDHSFI